MTEVQDEVSELISTLASIKLDSSSDRKEVVREAELLLTQNEGKELEEIQIAQEALAALTFKPGSKPSLQRIARLLSNVIIDRTAVNTENDEVVNKLARKLCRVLTRGRASKAGFDKIMDLYSGVEDSEQKKAISAAFETVLEKDNIAETWAPALSFVTLLNLTEGSVEPSILAKYIDLFTKSCMGKSFAPPEEILLAEFFVAQITADHFKSSVVSTLGLKLKANPETSFDTINAIVQALDNSKITFEGELIEGSKILPSVLKQLASSKKNLRALASSMLGKLGSFCGDGTLEEVVTSLSGAIGKKGTGSLPAGVVLLATSEHRLGAYSSLTTIVQDCLKNIDAYGDNFGEVTDKALNAIAASISRETTSDAKEVGIKCLVSWMIAHKKSGGAASSTGYDLSVDYLSQPILDAKPTGSQGSDFRFRLGGLFKLVGSDNYTLAESIALNIMEKETKKKKLGLQNVVDNCVKKHANSNLVAQIDGLVAIHLLLIYSNAKIGGGSSDKTVMSILPANALKVLQSGSKIIEKSSFLFSATMFDACAEDFIVQELLHRAIGLYTKLVAKARDSDHAAAECHGIVCMKNETFSAASYAVACCVSHSPTTVEASVKSMVLYSPTVEKASDALASAIFYRVNELSNELTEDDAKSINSGVSAENSMTIQNVATNLAKSVTNTEFWTKALVLMHYGLPSTDDEIEQDDEEECEEETGLEEICSEIISKLGEHISPSDVSNFITKFSCIQEDDAASMRLSQAVHSSTLSLISTLGKIAGQYDEEIIDPEEEESKSIIFAHSLCVKELSIKLSTNLNTSVKTANDLSSEDIELYLSAPGILFVPASKESGAGSEKKAKKKRSNEDDEWEMQVRKEIAQKKAKGKSGSSSVSAEDKKKISEQTAQRIRIKNVLESLSRTLNSIQALCLSDIEVGNSVLPTFSSSVTSAAISTSEAMKMKNEECLSTLRKLSTCVYEIEEDFADDVANALVACQINSVQEDSTLQIKIVPLPPKCDSAAIVLSEIEDYGDTLCGSSFCFLFPLIRAALTGPRTCQGCDAALQILDMHTELLSSDTVISTLRKDMASSVLELLCHDRSIAFKDPTAIEALVNIYTNGKKPSPTELAPLLGETGALGGKNSRLASITALAAIVVEHPRMMKTNPVVENRILVNCFAKDNMIKSEARRAWKLGSGVDEDETDLPAPSKMFAVALVPLLSNKDADIARAASEAFAFGISMHPSLSEKSFKRLFNTYIDSYATFRPDKTSQVPEAAIPAPLLEAPKPKKKAPKLDIGTVKKKPLKKKSGSMMASLTTTKTKTKKKTTKSSSVAFVPKKKERTIDQAQLAAQFSTKTVDVKKEGEKDTDEKISSRKGVFSVLTALTRSTDMKIEISMLKLLVGFLMAYGLADVNSAVRDVASNILRDTVASKSSKDAMDFLLPLLEDTLKNGKADKSCLGDLPTDKVLEDTDAADDRKEGVVVALGSAAIHLRDVEDVDKINETFKMLIAALSTPSESVQSSVALCLAKLMKKGNMKEQTEALLEQQMNECLHGNSLAARRGAAYGISAIVKGSGVASLKKFSVVTQLEEACASGTASTKEGALFAIELLSARLGLLFEPYVIVLLPSLLKSFSDNSDHVRSAARSSVGLIMGKLSGHGVKLLVPAVLAGLEEDDWRTKQASIHMLGSMSQCAPKQLASCLPSIVPKLSDAFTDTHPKVKSSAASSLEEISKVIRNPEISEIASTLLKALTDPSNGTVIALESLIETEFLHAIDAASLSLIVPVIHRGLRDRVATTKRYGALIAGNICTMINDPKDFVPYLPILMPDLQGVLLDPIPDCRSISAKALGSLTRSLGEATFPDLRHWLIETLKSESGTSVERSGAAQGLTEVIVAGGTNLVNEVMEEEILPLIDHPKAGAREGVLWVLTFLPSSLGQSFAPLIDTSFPALIHGLSDENESVRDVAMRAGRVTIRSHGKANVDKILPSVEDGLTNEDYRIRAASLNLLGDLLATLGGTKVSTGNVDTQDDIRQAERAQAQIALVLGSETRKRVFSALYIRRSDTAAVVRSCAVQVWKSVVSVTPRILKEILDVLVGQIVSALASGHPDHTQVAGRCLGDIVSKLGDTVLPEIMPVLRDALYRGDKHTRLGACVGLTEVIACSTKEQISKYINILVKVVQDALCDDDDEVRSMAASCFQNLYTTVGNKAFDEIVPSLLVMMEGNSGDEDERKRAINGITGILSIRSKDLLPYLIPRLVKKPMTRNQAAALGSICTVTGGSIHVYFTNIISSLLTELTSLFGEDLDEEEKAKEEALRQCFRSLSASVEEIGVYPLICDIAGKFGSDKEGARIECCWMMQVIIEERKEKNDWYEHIPIMLRELIHRLNDDSPLVLKSANTALAALSKHVPAEELVEHIEFIRNLIASMVSESRYRKGGVGDGEFLLPGFNMKKGLDPLLPIYQRGILYGDAPIREVSATGLGELMTVTSTKFLAGPFIIKVTGPLLRIVGDRNPSAVKIAIIKTLGLILSKGGPALRAFVPQFQTTFLKALSDPSRQVRVEAISAFSLLMPLSTRLDPLIKELVSTSLGNGAVSSLDSAAGLIAIQTATLEALAIVLKYGGKKAKLPESIPSALDAGKEMLFHEDDGVRTGASKVVGAACALMDASIANEVASELISADSPEPEERHGKCCMCRFMLESAGENLDSDIVDTLAKAVKGFMIDENTEVRQAACVAAGAVLGSGNDEKHLKLLQQNILKCMDPKESLELLKNMAKGLSITAEMNSSFFQSKSTQPLLDAALKNSMTGQQRVQLAFNNFLWLALDVKSGEDGLKRYTDEAMFENSKKMTSLFSKVLVRIKDVDIDDM